MRMSLLCAVMCAAAHAWAIPMASQQWTLNRLSEAEERLDASIDQKQDALPYPTNVIPYDAVSGVLSDYYTKEQTDEAIDSLAAYYITSNAEGEAFPTYAALSSASVFYSGGQVRVPTRNDYCVVLADEGHGGSEWRYIYAVHEDTGETNGQWEAQYPIETNDYDALSNRPQIGGVELTGNKSAADLGLLPTNAISAANPTFSNAVLSVGIGVDTNMVAAISSLVDGEASPLSPSGATTVAALLAALVAAVVALKSRKADVSALSYAFGPALTPESGAIQLADRAVNRFAPTSSVDPLAIRLPAQADDTKARDFFLRVDLTGSGASLANVSFRLSDGSAATIETPDSSYPSFEPGKVTLLYFAETVSGRFLIKSETVEVAS